MRPFLQALALLLCLGTVGCAELGTQPGPGTAEMQYTAPRERVKQAAVKVLTENGYTVSDDEASGARLTTGYREEIRVIWNWLVVSRFGIGRSRVRIDLTEGAEQTTHVKLEVLHDSKDGLFSRWGSGDIPLPQAPDTFLRLIRNELGLL
jgi:hypothetical protein